MIRVNETLEQLLHREDTDRDMMITVEDRGPKVCFPFYLVLF